MGYIPVSMRTDFAQIYPEGIMPAAEQYQEDEWTDAQPESETEEETLKDAA